ncbi:D-cysteine desulfhydrase family protein [Fontivita pretiosa]|uniref:D-cysteine desulfhydrase family protein n=1 Tax=Fontivita pretiosa TaxID=2989684 RepID=UPI003D163950
MIHPSEPPRIELARLPTPLLELKNLARQLGTSAILLKRDDLSGLETTGNKIRKLEYVIADALARGADVLLTTGALQSNHCRATAAAGARLGLRVRLLLRSAEAHPPNDGNLLLDRLFGAEISLHHPEQFKDPKRKQELIDAAMAAERQAGRRPYYFPVGASIPLGTWGYIRCIDELKSQLDPQQKADIFVPVGSSGTVAGLILGRHVCGCWNWRIVGVPICDSAEFFRADIGKLIRDTNQQYQLGLSDRDMQIELLDGFIGQGYAIPYPAAIDTIKLVARTEGVLLDPTYTGKAMTGMLHAMRNGLVRDGAVPVFVHTGGSFGVFARRDLFADLHT